MSTNTENFSVEDLPVVDHEVNWSEFEYPIKSYFSWEGEWQYGPILYESPVTCSEKEMLDTTKFVKVFLAQPGENDEEAWKFLVKHENGCYIFFDASCDYTGFDCQGGGKIFYSKDPKQMWLFGLDDITREQLLEN